MIKQVDQNTQDFFINNA